MRDDGRSLAGKTVLITGGAKRVGAEIARELHAAGANLVIHYRKSSKEAEALAEELNRARGKSAAIVPGELLEVEKLPVLVEFAVRSFGALDVLVNNASTFYPTKIGEITPQAWDDLLGTNLTVPTFLSFHRAGLCRNPPSPRRFPGSGSSSTCSRRSRSRLPCCSG